VLSAPHRLCHIHLRSTLLRLRHTSNRSHHRLLHTHTFAQNQSQMSAAQPTPTPAAAAATATASASAAAPASTAQSSTRSFTKFAKSDPNASAASIEDSKQQTKAKRAAQAKQQKQQAAAKPNQKSAEQPQPATPKKLPRVLPECAFEYFDAHTHIDFILEALDERAKAVWPHLHACTHFSSLLHATNVIRAVLRLAGP
jgi:hypothetical protein